MEGRGQGYGGAEQGYGGAPGKGYGAAGQGYGGAPGQGYGAAGQGYGGAPVQGYGVLKVWIFIRDLDNATISRQLKNEICSIHHIYILILGHRTRRLSADKIF